jgi:pyrroloquinoline quinone biosynthesis protein D
LILLNPDDGQYFTLDEVGGRAWELCDGARTIADVAAVLQQEFDAPLSVIQADVLELLDDLGRERLVIVDP